MSAPSVQLYSVREALAADLIGTVARVADLGFDRVEPYAFVEHTADYARAFAAAGVSAPSGHASVIDVDDPARVFDAAGQLGIGTVIDPFVPSERWQTADDARRNADRVNELADAAAAVKLSFGYHNHHWELQNTVDGRPIYDLFVERLAPSVVLEVDTFWSTVGGQVGFLHIKDGAVVGDIASALPSAENALDVPDAFAAAFLGQTPAGQGDIDIRAILAASPSAIRVVEFDAYRGDIFEGLAASLAWLIDNDS